MRRNIFYVAAVLLLAAFLAGHSLAQQEQEREGIRREKDGTIIIPETEPIEDRPVAKGFLLDISSIDIKDTPAGPTFIMKGISKFPDGTTVSVAIKFYEERLPGTYRRVIIRSGKFEVTFEASKLWAGKKFFPGNYELEVEIDPRRESRRIKRLIDQKLGPRGKTRAYRNKYVTVGTKERMKQEEDRVKEHYVNVMWEAQKLFSDLKEKFKAAKVRYTSKFYKRDKDDKPQKDPDNENAYLVNEQEFRKYLRDKPNEFYDRTGVFQEQVWRDWLDSVWRLAWKKLLDDHKRLKGNYAAIPWPRQYNEMTTALKMLMKRSADHSESLYKWSNLPPSKKDKLSSDPWPVRVSDNSIKRLMLSVRYKLRLDEYIKSKKAKDEEKKNK